MVVAYIRKRWRLSYNCPCRHIEFCRDSSPCFHWCPGEPHKYNRKTRDALRASKTVFLAEKGTFEICLSREKGTLFFLDLYVSAHFNKVFTLQCVNVAKGTFSTKNLFRVTFSAMWTRIGGDFHQEVKTRLGGVDFGHACVHCYIWVLPPRHWWRWNQRVVSHHHL